MKRPAKTMMSWSAVMPVVFAVLLALWGCGGGGGDDAAPPPPPIEYTGVTAEASVTEANADDLLSLAYGGGEFGLIAGAQTSQQQTRHFRYPALLLFLKKSVDEGRIDRVPSPGLSAATKTETRSYSGNCGGTMTITLTYDDVSGDYSGSIAFNGYCNDGLTGSGTAGISGRLDPGTGDMLTLSMSSNMLDFRKGTDSFQIRFDISYNMQVSAWPVTLNSWLREPSGKTYWIDNYAMTVQPEPLSNPPVYVDFTMAGRAYHPDYGFVTVQMTTPVIPFRLYNTFEWPSVGQMEAAGAPGAAGGDSNARLTVLNDLQYQIEVDENGDAAYELTEILNW